MPLYDVDALLAEARRQRGQVESLGAPLGDHEFEWRPDAGRWSIGECLEHLALINGIYLDAIDAALAEARAAGLRADPAERAKGHGRVGDAFVRSLEPPPGRLKGKAFARTVPSQKPKSVVLPAFLGAQDRLLGTIEDARGLDFRRARMRSPFFRLLRLTLGQSFGAVLAHNRRHIWQAEGVLALLRTSPQSRD
ncbi:MAG TPA: DinB family protein [Longimicrobiales bacterium]